MVLPGEGGKAENSAEYRSRRSLACCLGSKQPQPAAHTTLPSVLWLGPYSAAEQSTVSENK